MASQIQASVDSGSNNLTDINLNTRGKLVVGSRFATVITTTTDLDTADSFPSLVPGRPSSATLATNPACPRSLSFSLMASNLATCQPGRLPFPELASPGVGYSRERAAPDAI